MLRRALKQNIGKRCHWRERGIAWGPCEYHGKIKGIVPYLLDRSGRKLSAYVVDQDSGQRHYVSPDNVIDIC